MQETCLNKRAAHTRRSRGTIEVSPSPDALEYWPKCKCGSIIHMNRGDTVECPCGRLLRWRTSPPPLVPERAIEAQP